MARDLGGPGSGCQQKELRTNSAQHQLQNNQDMHQIWKFQLDEETNIFTHAPAFVGEFNLHRLYQEETGGVLFVHIL